jgi:O-antigen/teichoic acid export membrane protein
MGGVLVCNQEVKRKFQFIAVIITTVRFRNNETAQGQHPIHSLLESRLGIHVHPKGTIYRLLHVLQQLADRKGQVQFTSTLRLVAKVISGNLAASLITMVTSILIARWTIPYDMGIWNTALLVTVYSPALQLGIFNGLNRELPYLIGAGDKDRALRMAKAAYSWSWLLMCVSIIFGLFVAVWFWTKGQPVWCFTSIAVAVLVVCSWPTYYFTTTYRTHAEFGRLAKNTVVVALAGVVLVPLVWRFHFNGLILRASLLSIFSVAALYFRRPLPVKPQWGTNQLVLLAKVGIPIWLVGQLGTFFVSLDRLMLVRSTQVLGYFTIAIQVGTFVRMIPGAFSAVLYPQMAHRYGESHCAMDLWQIAKKGAIAASVLGLIAGACGWLLLPTFVRLVLPKYGPGIRAAQLSGFLGLAMGMYLFDNIYNVIKRQDLYVINWCIGCSSFFLIWYALTRVLQISLTIASAESILAATFVMALVSSLVSRRACLAHDRRIRVHD